MLGPSTIAPCFGFPAASGLGGAGAPPVCYAPLQAHACRGEPLTEISWYRRLAWTPLIIPPILAFYSGGTDPRNRVWVLLWLTVVYGAPAYAAFALLALRWLGPRPVAAWRRFGLVAPLLFAVWFTLVQGGLFTLLDGNAARGFTWAAFMAGYAIPIGYVFVTLAALGRPRGASVGGQSVSG